MSLTIREQIQHAKQQELLTVEQVALLAQYNPQTVYRKAKKGEIPGLVRFGRGIRFVRVRVLQWVTRNADDRDIRQVS